MTPSSSVFLAACGVLFFVPLYFVINHVYQDGIIGRASLLGISFIAGTFVAEALFGDTQYDIPLQITLLVLAFTAFLCWHLWRFHRRVLRRKERPVEDDRRAGVDRRFAGGQK